MNLTIEQHALYVDALVSDEQGRLPEEILEHVADCFECKVDIVEVWELMDAIRPLDMIHGLLTALSSP